MGNYEYVLRILNGANIAYTTRKVGTGIEVSVASCAGANNNGADGLYTTWCFNEYGELESVGVWEGAPPKALALVG